MTDPATLSLADLAAAVVRLGAHRGDDTLVSGNCDSGSIWIWEDIDEDACSLLLLAANRLPAVVAECERLRKLALEACDEAADLAQHDDTDTLDVINSIRIEATP